MKTFNHPFKQIFAALAACSFIHAMPAQAQTKWIQRYNGPGNADDRAKAVAVDSANNVIVTGYSYGSGFNTDYYTAKYAAADGALIWEVRYNGPGNGSDGATAIAVDGSGNVVVTGVSQDGSGNDDYYTAKYAAANGALIWEKRYNGPGNSNDGATAVAIDSSGNVVVTGYSVGSGGNNDIYTAKYAATDGALIWENRYNDPGNGTDGGNAIVVDSSDNVVVTGVVPGSGFGFDFYTAKYAAADGSLIWEKTYNGPGASNDSPQAIAVDSANNVVVTGYSYGSGGNSDFYTAKYAAANGALIWEKRYNGPENANDEARAVAIDGSDNVVVTGGIGAMGGDDIYTAKYAAANGALIWEKRYGGSGNVFDETYAMALDSSSNVVVTGQSSNGFYTAKYAAADGALLSEMRYYSVIGNFASALAIATDSSDNVVVTGISTGTGSGSDYVTIKYGPLAIGSVAMNGDAAAGITNPSAATGFFSTFGQPAMNNKGHTAFAAKVTGPGYTSANSTGIWADNSAGTRQLVICSGTSAPDASGSASSAAFKKFGDPVYNNNDAVAFLGTLVQGTGGVTSSNDTGIWSNDGGTLHLVAQEGGQAPSCAAGVVFSKFTQFALPDQGGVVMLAKLSDGKNGIFAVDTGGTLQLIAHEGDVQSVTGKTIKTLVFLPPLSGISGQTRSFSQSTGDIVYLATFTDKSSGIFKVVFP